MGKFLSGGQFSGSTVALCSFWRNDFETDVLSELSLLRGTGERFAQADEGKDSAIGSFSGQCIANAFYPKSTITCFNQGRCNDEGKCITCSRYRYGGMRMAITHSPPLDSLKYFNKGLTEDEMKSPNLVRFPPEASQSTVQDQLPYHVLVRNIQAEIAKCCHWSAGDGAPSEYYLDQIRTGPDTATITNSQGEEVTYRGVRVINSAFPDEVGTFFPAGTVVVAGYVDQPSFYLEPRTGLQKTGEDVLFNFSGEGTDVSPATVTTKQIASATNNTVGDAVNASILACQTATEQFNRDTAFYNNALNTGDPNTIAAAEAKLNAAVTSRDVACTAATDATTLGQDCINLIADVIQADNSTDLFTQSAALAVKLRELAVEVEAAGAAVGSTSAAEQCSRQVSLLLISARHLEVASRGGQTKCEFFFQSDNVAEMWNSPEDGSLPCNGIRTDCPYYTGEPWIYATDEKLELGRPILAEQLQEVRFRAEDWSKYSDPEEQFRSRFSTPFIWAFSEYVSVNGEPEVEDMLLYRPKILFARDEAGANYETVRMERVRISDFDNFEVNRNAYNITPGSETLDKDGPPPFPSTIAQPAVPSAIRLNITHPRLEDGPFVYRMWSPDKNKISLFGTASPDQTVYVINNTALRHRSRYHSAFGTKDFFDIPTGLPKTPDFVGLTATELLTVVRELRNEKISNGEIEAPLGFDEVSVSQAGFWQSVQEVDLVHNQINEVYVFLVGGENNVLSDKAIIDCRFLHSVIAQTGFDGQDFTMLSLGVGGSKLGTNAADTIQKGVVTAEGLQHVGANKEQVDFGYGYFALRFKDRGLSYGVLNADNDLQGQNPVADQTSTFLVTEASPSEFIVNVAYNVVQYEKKDQVVEEWYLINDCGYIMLKLEDPNINRVLPLPNQEGNYKAIPDILVNGGSRGSEIAQWGLTAVTLSTSTGEKELVQYYRDPDGLGLPANYVVVGPSLDNDGSNAFGRPDPTRDTITISYTFLRAQGTKHDPNGIAIEPADEPELSETVITNNFYNDNLRVHRHAVAFQDGVLTAGGETEATRISQDQQEYVFVFNDSDGRPLGKKVTRLQVMYYDLACINVEIFYKWSAECTTYALIPDRLLYVGSAGGQVGQGRVGATDDPSDDRLQLGFRIKNLLGPKDCSTRPNCGDHEYIKFGPLRREFEKIVSIEGTEGEPGYIKAIYPSAGQADEGTTVSVEEPGSQFLRRYGPTWYPYTACERPRYLFNTNGPLRTDSTELINTTLVNPGIVQGGTAVATAGGASFAGQGGSFGALPSLACEAFHGPDQVTPRILDIHPSLRPCTSAYTYCNQVLKSGSNRFAGYARKRGAFDTTVYEDLQWQPPPFGNFGRPQLVFEVSDTRGDFIKGGGGQVGRRWMPMFPTRENLGATVGLFGETMEPQAYRILSVSTPLGTVSETIPTGGGGGGLTVLGVPRYTQKSLIVNKTAASINFPFSPYFPMFLPDANIGTEPEDGRPPVTEGSQLGPISTMWGWREQEKSIQRAVTGVNIMKGVSLAAPDYFIDNRRLEIRIRPDEGSHILSWVPPRYFIDGSLRQNASIKLGDGPPREIVIDFKNRIFQVADQPGSLYDATQELGGGVLPCTDGTPTDNPQLAALCSCITDINDSSLEGSGKLPARFMHLDELTPGEGYVALYENDTYQVPFAVDIPRERNSQPCCMCVYYIRGIFFKLNGDYLPAVTNINPLYDSSVDSLYTWSRVPHGLETDVAVDGVFNSYEQLADSLVDFSAGEVFTNVIQGNQGSLDPLNDGGAIFPSSRLATGLAAGEDPDGIAVKGALPAGDPRLKGGTPVNDDRESQGEDEEIVLTMIFNTYVRITGVSVTFYAGEGFEAPKYELAVVPPENRIQDMVTTNASRNVGTASEYALGGNIPNRSDLDDEDVRDGRAKFVSRLLPSYSNLPFWESYGMEWQLRFPRRGAAYSMGIASISVTLDGLTYGSQNTEVIGIRERKYYRSIGSVPGDRNPERYLGELDSATVYWRTTETGSFRGHNRHRTYAFGDQIEDNQGRIESSDIGFIEGLQEAEYDKARSLLGSPYQYQFQSVTPLDEQEWLNLVGGGGASWTLSMTNAINSVDKIVQPANDQPLYGVVPFRQVWNAPGHTWVHTFEESYIRCCLGCAHSMVINYEFLHLHDNLALVETANFWTELPSGFTRLIRSTMMLPDATFQGGEGGVGSTVLLGVEQFTDSQGNAISTDTLNAAGFTQSADGSTYYVDGASPEAGVNGPSGPAPGCGATGGGE